MSMNQGLGAQLAQLNRDASAAVSIHVVELHWGTFLFSTEESLLSREQLAAAAVKVKCWKQNQLQLLENPTREKW